MTTNEKLARWIVQRAEDTYAQDIALVLLYGSFVNGTANPRSDVDCYFIPKTERGLRFACSFIVDGIGYDIFPMSWERVERIADLKDAPGPCVADAVILTAGAPEDRERFESLQSRMMEHLRDQAYMDRLTEQKCAQARDLYTQMCGCRELSRARLLAGELLMALADAVAYDNQDIFHYGLKKQLEDLRRFQNRPEHFVEGYLQVIRAESVQDIQEACRQLLESMGGSGELDAHSPSYSSPGPAGSRRPDYAALAVLYEEICSTFQKIYVCAQTGNAVLAFLSAVCLQRDLLDAAAEQGLQAFDILSAYHYTDLGILTDAVRAAERRLVRLIEDGGGNIKRYANFEEFEQAGL